MCNCISYNLPELCDPNGQSETILEAPEWSSRRTICIDSCITDAIKMLWENGVMTKGCCCGHNRANPSVMIDEAEDGPRVLNLLKTYDGRTWDVMQWKLMTVDEEKGWRESDKRHLSECEVRT